MIFVVRNVTNIVNIFIVYLITYIIDSPDQSSNAFKYIICNYYLFLDLYFDFDCFINLKNWRNVICKFFSFITKILVSLLAINISIK